MKNLTYALMAIAALGLSSCSSDEPAVAVNDGDGVTFTVQLPDFDQSRSPFDRGTFAENLVVAAYDTQGSYITSLTTTFPQGQLSTQVSLPLLKGREYKVIFWAQKNGTGVYNFDVTQDNPMLTVDYSKLTGNSEDFDCFYNFVETGTIVTNMTPFDVTLTRPLAQINVGTSDLGFDAVVKDFGTDLGKLTTNISTTAYDTFNLLTGEATNQVAVNFTGLKPRAGYPDPQNSSVIIPEPFPVSGYEYLAMTYVLEAKANTPATTTVTFCNSGNKVSDIVIPNLPLQRNYRTNIFGQLLTNNTQFNVTIDPIYENERNIDVAKWFMGLPTQPSWDAQTNEWIIKTPAQLDWYINAMADPTGYGVDDINNQNAAIGADIDMYGNTLSQIAKVTTTIDGRNHTISNFTITGTERVTALVTTLTETGTIKNLILENATVSGPMTVGALVGESNGTIKNCSLLNSEVTGCHYVGGLIGKAGSGALEDNTVENSTVMASVWQPGEGDKAGGLVGYTTGLPILNNTIKGNTVRAYREAGGLGGRCAYNNTITGNVIENNIIGPILDANGQPNSNCTLNSFWAVASWVGNDAAGNTISGNSVYPVQP